MTQPFDLSVRRATVADIEILTDFNLRLAHETEATKLNIDTVRSGVTRGLLVGDEVQYFVAETSETVIGQVMLTREWSDWRNGWMAWLQSIYVVVDYRRRGVLRHMLDIVRAVMAERPDVICLRLYVEEENETAITTYRRLGFQHPGYRVMELPLR